MTSRIFRDVDSILNTLTNQNTSNLEAVDKLLEVYNTTLKKHKESDALNPEAKKHPLIIFEGLDGCGKSTITKKITSKFQAVQWCTPPESIRNIRNLFDDHKELRTAYYALGNYIAALECSIILKKQPVIMDRYWHSTVSYAIAQAVHDFAGKVEMPPQNDNFYNWPDDLLKPDAVIFFNVDEDIRLQRLSRRAELTVQESLLTTSKQFRDNVILAYKNMTNPGVIFVDGNSTVNNVVGVVVDKLKELELFN